jgi:hypothetical protein
MHMSACKHLLNENKRNYSNFRKKVKQQLPEIDELSLQLHLELSFKYGQIPVETNCLTVSKAMNVQHGPPEIEWWTHIQGDEVSNCERVVKAFLDTPGEPPEEERHEFVKSFCLWVLCGGDKALEEFLARVENTNEVMSRFLVPQHDELDELDKWLVKLRYIVDAVKHSVSMLPLHLQDTLSDAAETLLEQYKELGSSSCSERISAGLRYDLPVPNPIRWPRNRQQLSNDKSVSDSD